MDTRHLKIESRPGRAALVPILAIVLGVLLASPVEANRLKVSHLYNLSDFSGAIPSSYARLYADVIHDEIYVADGSRIRVFNASGMEVFRFGENSDLGAVRGLAVDASGDIYALAYDVAAPAGGPGFSIAWCDYRGEVRDRIRVTGLPREYSAFLPHYMFYRDEKFLLVDRLRMLAAEVDRNGAVRTAYDLGAMIGVEEKDRPDTEIFGFCVDGDGNMFFTVPVHFQVYRIGADGAVSSFGKAGSAPGMFGVVTGVAVDGRGSLFVSDKRRQVVMVFDRQFRFLQEFGGYGMRKENLAYPDDLCVDASGRLYVSQMRNRGVAVFQVVSN